MVDWKLQCNIEHAQIGDSDVKSITVRALTDDVGVACGYVLYVQFTVHNYAYRVICT